MWILDRNDIYQTLWQVFAADSNFDDTNVFVFRKSLSETNLKAEEVVKELDQRFLANKLSLSIDKTCYSIFSYHDISLIPRN